MTVDVEDYFQVQAFAGCIDRVVGRLARGSRANVDRILEQFAGAGVQATFFTLGWVAERHPAMVRRIVAAGHELASHGWDHTRADTQDAGGIPRRRQRAPGRLLEDIGGVPVIGYRAATFSIGARNHWAFGDAAEAGYGYSSSINPIRHDLYGMPDAPRVPFRPDGGGVVGNPDDHCARARPQLALFGRRLFPPAAVRRFTGRASHG